MDDNKTVLTDGGTETDDSKSDGQGLIPKIKSNLPSELLGRAQWVCWEEEERDGKMTKIPVNPESGRRAKVNDNSTWTDFGTAATHYKENQGIAGLGYMFKESGPFMGVDLDDCIDPNSGEVADWAWDICDTLQSYTEFSTSGTGFHVILKNQIPGDRSRKGDVDETGLEVSGQVGHADEKPKSPTERQQTAQGNRSGSE